jgi:Thiamine pyrophosphate enzyme, N-terminal TPP binding domain
VRLGPELRKKQSAAARNLAAARDGHGVQAERTVANLLVDCLEEEGVRYVFGIPGEETEDLLFALAESSISFVP